MSARLTGILLLCVAGAWISGELLIQHADPAGGGVLARICRGPEGAESGCAAAAGSGWSRLAVPLPGRRVEVPVAFAGLAYFVFMGVWYAAAGGRRAPGRPWHRVPLHVALSAVPVSILFVGVMVIGAAPWCPLCIAVHAVNVLLAAAVWYDLHRPARRCTMLTMRRGLAAAAITLAVTGTLWVLYDAHARNALVREHAAQPRHEFPLRPGEPDRDGRPRLVVFTDFRCPACRCNAAEIHDRIVGYFDGRIDVLVRHFPLGPEAEEAARAAEAARRLGGEQAFSRMHRELFLNRDELGPDLYRRLAREIGIDPDELAAAMGTPAVRDAVAADVALGRRVGVDGTPAMFLDGRRVTEPCRTPVFWQTVAAMHRSSPGSRE